MSHLTFFSLVSTSAPPPIPPHPYPCFLPTSFLLHLSGCVEELEIILLRCNLFRIYWGRSVVFISSYSSHIYAWVTHEISARKSFESTKYPQLKILGPQNTHEKIFWTPRNTHEKKFWTHETSTKKVLDPRNTHERKFLNPRNIHQESLGPTKYPREEISDPRHNYEKKVLTHEIPTRKNFGPARNPQEKILDPRRHDDRRPTRPTIVGDPRNLTHSVKTIKWKRISKFSESHTSRRIWI